MCLKTFAAITARTMAKDPRSRYPSAREMLADLEEFRRNPNVKFEYHDEPAPMAGEPTRYMDGGGKQHAWKDDLSGRAGQAPGHAAQRLKTGASRSGRRKRARPRLEAAHRGHGRGVLPWVRHS